MKTLVICAIAAAGLFLAGTSFAAGKNPAAGLGPGVKVVKTSGESPADLGARGKWLQLNKKPNLSGFKLATRTLNPDQFVSTWKKKGITVGQVDDGGPGPFFVKARGK
jgi:hypothetical protein